MATRKEKKIKRILSSEQMNIHVTNLLSEQQFAWTAKIELYYYSVITGNKNYYGPNEDLNLVEIGNTPSSGVKDASHLRSFHEKFWIGIITSCLNDIN